MTTAVSDLEKPYSKNSDSETTRYCQH